MRTAYLDFSSAFGYSQSVVALGARVVSVVFILILFCFLDNKFFPWLNKLDKLGVFPLSCADILRHSTINNDDVRYRTKIVNIGYINKRQYTRNKTADYHQRKIQQVVAVSAIHKSSEFFHHKHLSDI